MSFDDRIPEYVKLLKKENGDLIGMVDVDANPRARLIKRDIEDLQREMSSLEDELDDIEAETSNSPKNKERRAQIEENNRLITLLEQRQEGLKTHATAA